MATKFFLIKNFQLKKNFLVPHTHKLAKLDCIVYNWCKQARDWTYYLHDLKEIEPSDDICSS